MPLLIRKELSVRGLKPLRLHKKFQGVKDREIYLGDSESSCPTNGFADMKDRPTNAATVPTPKPKKSVSFKSLDIREYCQILGDHPCCSDGTPVSLGWSFEAKPSVLLDDYEDSRCLQRRSGDDLRLSQCDRREILQEYSDSDVRRVQRKLHRERSSCRRGKAMRSFFQPGLPAVSTCPE